MLKKYGNKNGWLFGQSGLYKENDTYIIGHVRNVFDNPKLLEEKK